MRVAIPGMPDQYQKLIDEFADRSFNYVKAPLETLINPPPVLYHYTDARGLTGILEHGTLWLSDIQKMNDLGEIRHGLRMASKILTANAGSGLRNKLRRLFASMFAEKVEKALTGQQFHIACFTDDGDDLSQWRG